MGGLRSLRGRGRAAVTHQSRLGGQESRRDLTWGLLGPANQKQQLAVQQVTQRQQAALIGRDLQAGGQGGGLRQQQA